MIRCVSCGAEYDDDEVIYTCEKCGSVLELVSDIDVSKDIFDGRKDNLWKFKECIPVDETKIVSLNEGGTPFCKCDKLGDELGVNLYVKVEGSNPTGSFKDRGMTVGMTKAMELGVSTVGCASTGNTSASLAAYAARAGLRCIVFLPSGKVALGKLAQAMFHGAEVMSINGNFDEALEAMTSLALEKYLYLLNSINPYRLEGQKTIVYNAGFVKDLPMMTGIQAEGACPVTNAFKKGDKRVVPVENPETVATAIRIGAPVSDIKALNAIYDSKGYSETVSDEEILDAQKLLARTEGIGVEPASAASIAGLKKLVDQGVIDKGETITCVVTGHLLKDPNTAIDACTKPIEVDADIDTLRKLLMNE